MVQVADVMAMMEEQAPTALAEPWDNVGLMFGDRTWEVQRILLAVDPTSRIATQAEDQPHTMVITHHPLFFDPIRALVAPDLAFLTVGVLAEWGIPLYSAHTNLDKSPYGTGPALAEALGLSGGDASCSDEIVQHGLMWLAELVEPVTVHSLAQHVVERLGACSVHVVQEGGIIGGAQRIALVPGSGGDELAAAREAGAQVLITGEIKHHQALEAEFLGPTVITAGHFETERPVLGLLQRALRERLPEVAVHIAEESSPIRSVHRS